MSKVISAGKLGTGGEARYIGEFMAQNPGAAAVWSSVHWKINSGWVAQFPVYLEPGCKKRLRVVAHLQNYAAGTQIIEASMEILPITTDSNPVDIIKVSPNLTGNSNLSINSGANIALGFDVDDAALITIENEFLKVTGA